MREGESVRKSEREKKKKEIVRVRQKEKARECICVRKNVEEQRLRKVKEVKE